MDVVWFISRKEQKSYILGAKKSIISNVIVGIWFQNINCSTYILKDSSRRKWKWSVSNEKSSVSLRQRFGLHICVYSLLNDKFKRSTMSPECVWLLVQEVR